MIEQVKCPNTKCNLMTPKWRGVCIHCFKVFEESEPGVALIGLSYPIGTQPDDGVHQGAGEPINFLWLGSDL